MTIVRQGWSDYCDKDGVTIVTMVTACLERDQERGIVTQSWQRDQSYTFVQNTTDMCHILINT